MSEYTKGLEEFWVKNCRVQTMSIVYEDSMFGTNGMRRMMEVCEQNAIEIKQIISYDKDRASGTYFRPLVAMLTDDPPDVVYMISYLKDAIALVKTIRELKIKSMLCGGAGGFTHEDFIKGAGEDANLLLTATLWFKNLPYPGAEVYYSQYVKLYSAKPDYHGVEAYSALMVVADALRRATSLSPETIRQALAGTYMGTPFGPVKFYSYFDFERQNSVRTQVLQVVNGEFQCVWPPDLATAKFILPDK
ncbi:ABC transporter substrate-binding protein [Thermodesulfobacteriota bacterium]